MISYRVASTTPSGVTSWGQQRTLTLAVREFRQLRKRYPTHDHRLVVADTATCPHVDTRTVTTPIFPEPRTWCIDCGAYTDVLPEPRT